MQPWLAIILIASAVSVAYDASRLGARRGALGGGLLDMGPISWFFACLLIPIIGIPCYFVARPRLTRRARALAADPVSGFAPYPPQHFGYAPAAVTGFPSHAGAAPYVPPNPSHLMPPPGYYTNPDPSDGQSTRWWDGQKWC